LAPVELTYIKLSALFQAKFFQSTLSLPCLEAVKSLSARVAYLRPKGSVDGPTIEKGVYAEATSPS
jgi:hypothetical protein